MRITEADAKQRKGIVMLEKHSGVSRRTFMALGAAASVASLGLLSGCSQEESPKSEPTPAPEDAAPEEPSAQPETKPEEKVYVVDTFMPKPGDGKAFLDDYLKTYRPMAENAGMTLHSTTVAPPMWLDSDSNTIQVIWTLDDLAVAAWAMSSATRYNPEYVEWCAAVRKRVVSRDRSYFASEEYMEVLNNV